MRLDEAGHTRQSSGHRLNQHGIVTTPYIVLEKSQMLREVEAEYKELLRQLEEDENVTREDIEAFKKNALVHQSIIEVRKRAHHQAEIR